MSKEIILPIELFDGRLSLTEIGTVGVIMSYPHQPKEVLDKWDGTDIFNTTIDDMMDRGMMVMDNGKIIININDEKIKKENMKIEAALTVLYERGLCNEDNMKEIRDVMEDLSNEFYRLGYEDGGIDFGVDADKSAYGKE
jgi:hypothetical protein